MNFPTPEEMEDRAYGNHGLKQEALDELEMMLRHKISGGLRDFILYFGDSSIDPFAAFKFLRTMKYDVSMCKGLSAGTIGIAVRF